jgi:hypothetical protein
MPPLEEEYLTSNDTELKLLRKVEKLATKLARTTNHTIFLKRCISENITPKGLVLKFPVRNDNANAIKTKAERSLVRERLQHWIWRRSLLHRQLEYQCKLTFETMEETNALHNWNVILKKKDEEFHRCKAKQVRKFLQLKQRKKEKHNLQEHGFEDCVINLSSSFLSNEEVGLLSKGFKFVPSQKKLPVEEFITGVEDVARRLNEEKADELRFEMKKILKDSYPPRQNLSREEKKAITSLKAKNVVITQADKGNSTVVLDKQEYEEKLVRVTETETFMKLKKDPTEAEARKVTKLLTECEKRGEISREERLRLTVKAPRCPVLFGLPKLHKEGVPLRPIVSFIDSPTYLLAKELARILRPLHGNSSSFIKDSNHLCDVLADFKVSEDSAFVSYDVENLFGSVPAAEAAEMAWQRVESDPSLQSRTGLSAASIKELLLFCVNSNFFVCKGVVYRTSTCPMGSPLSPILASIFMEVFEEGMLNAVPIEIRLWKRYVDDTLVIVKRGDEEELLRFLNNVHPAIKFTCEKEVEESIPFLDVKISRVGNDGLVRTDVFRKPTATDRYLDFSSAHSLGTKWGLVSCLKKRAEKVCRGKEELEREIKRLMAVFLKNGFPKKGLVRRLRQNRSSEKVVPPCKEPTMVVPYVPDVGEKVLALARRLGLQVRFKRGRSLGTCLGGSKLDRQSELEVGGVIYRQACRDCDKVYIGETGRRAGTRKKEHQRDVKEVNLRSAIAEHCHSLSHRPDFDSFTVLDREKDWARRKIKESVYIMQHSTFNRDEGWKLGRLWKGLFDAF